MRIICFSLIILTSISSLAHADVIYLKNGNQMEGEIVEETDKKVTLEVLGGTFGMPKADIVKIERTDTPTYLEAERAAKKDDVVEIEITEPFELDFKTKREVYNVRKRQVNKYPQFAPKNYKPSEEVFGQIEDKKPWWGLLGASYYGNGKQSIEGASEETRFLGNPYLLVGLTEAQYVFSKDLGFLCVPNYPRLDELIWDKNAKWVKCKYRLSEYFYELKRRRCPKKYQRQITLAAYNAKDLGFNYLFVDPVNSRNIRSPNKEAKPVLIRQFIHCGGSCGYPGGCNNMSPHQPNLEIDVYRLPARMSIKLWRDEPKTTSAPADMLYTMELK